MGLEYEFIQSSFIVESSSKFFLEKKKSVYTLWHCGDYTK